MRYITAAKEVLEIEIDAIQRLRKCLDEKFDAACEILQNCRGRIVVIGMGKSGHIGNKIAATFASTGSPAFFVHPAEASHGDLGMIMRNDVVLALSRSGNTAEIITLLPVLKKLQIPVIAITAKADSALDLAAQVTLLLDVEKEACPLDLAPTASTTATLVLGDALAVALLTAKGFSKQDFALSHPAGTLGKGLTLCVEDVMRKDGQIPAVNLESNLQDTILEISTKGLGMTTVLNKSMELEGVFTDGDLRRTLNKTVNLQNETVKKFMQLSPKTTKPQELAINALNLMQQFKITSLIVTNPNSKQVVGVLHMHDLLSSGIV